MRTRHQHIYHFVAFLSCLLAASWAQAATIDMVFFDNDKNIVGNGQFSFLERSIEICLESPGGGCIPDQDGVFAGTLITIVNPLNSFAATVNSHVFRSSGGWWASDSQRPGHVSSSRFGQSASSGWTHFSSSAIDFALSLNFSTANESSGSGTWETLRYDIVTNTFINATASGTFTATATPIPAAVWLFLSGLGLLLWFGRKAS